MAAAALHSKHNVEAAFARARAFSHTARILYITLLLRRLYYFYYFYQQQLPEQRRGKAKQTKVLLNLDDEECQTVACDDVPNLQQLWGWMDS